MKKLIFAMAVAAAGAAAAGVSFSYQGALKNADGTSIPEGERNKTIEFRLYEGPTDSNALWGLQTIVHLDENGLFNVELSDTLGTPLTNVKTNNLDWVLASYLGDSKTLYIGLYVSGSTGEIRPRQKLLNVPAAAFAADVAHAKNNFEVAGIATFNGAVNAETNMTVEGSLTVGGALAASSFNMIPQGVIVMWSGAADKVPEGWVLCDGKNHGGVTPPDLRGRFIVGASEKGEKGGGVDVAYNVKDTGGKNSVPMEDKYMDWQYMPFHWHYFWYERTKLKSSALAEKEYSADPWVIVGIDNHEMQRTSYLPVSDIKRPAVTGHGGEIRESDPDYHGSKPHENRPPYYALCFIMKK